MKIEHCNNPHKNLALYQTFVQGTLWHKFLIVVFMICVCEERNVYFYFTTKNMTIRSQRPQKLLMDQKHDTHLFVEVNQAISVWSIRQLYVAISRLILFDNIKHFSCSEVFIFCKIYNFRTSCSILSNGPNFSCLIHFYKEVCIMLLVH